jgi:hypothetical protein
MKKKFLDQLKDYLLLIFTEFWNLTTVKTSDRVSFEIGGFIISMGLTIFILWLFGLLN